MVRSLTYLTVCVHICCCVSCRLAPGGMCVSRHVEVSSYCSSKNIDRHGHYRYADDTCLYIANSYIHVLAVHTDHSGYVNKCAQSCSERALHTKRASCIELLCVHAFDKQSYCLCRQDVTGQIFADVKVLRVLWQAL